jgi:hypothetical protein
MKSALKQKFKSSMAKETKPLSIIPTAIYATSRKESAGKASASKNRGNIFCCMRQLKFVETVHNSSNAVNEHFEKECHGYV